MITITNNYAKDLQTAKEAGLVNKFIKKAELYAIIEAHNNAPMDNVLETGTVDEFETAAKAGRVISLSGMANAIHDEQKAFPQFIEPEAVEVSVEVIENDVAPNQDVIHAEGLIDVVDESAAIEAARQSLRSVSMMSQKG